MTLIAIDGGGTKTEIVAFKANGRVVGHRIEGACNPNLFGFEECASRLADAFRSMGVAVDAESKIYIGTAGIFTAEDGPRFAAQVSRCCGGAVVKCENDAMNVMASASDGGDCVAGVCGTGSIAFARSAEGVRRFGGAGHLLDSRGSGYGIGVDALRLLMRDRDRGVFSPLSGLVLSAYAGEVAAKSGRDGVPPPSAVDDGQKAADDLALEVYRREPAFVAAFARVVFDAVRAGDADAGRILQENVCAFARLLESAAAWTANARLAVVSGGIAERPEFLERLRRELEGKLEVVVPAYPQIVGACLNCAVLAGLAPREVKAEIVESYRKAKAGIS